jgi:ATP-dependent Clp protease adaptor protein ClpS
MPKPDFDNAPLPEIEQETTEKKRARPVLLPRYHVILHDDDDHTYDYVIEMLMAIFRHSQATAFEMACEVDARGRVIVDTTTQERAELKRDQIHDYGPDWRLPRSQGSMSASIEPADDEG